MLQRLLSRFSTKKAGYFWTEINPCVRESEYAVRGVVPTLANIMQDEIKKGSKSNHFNIQIKIYFLCVGGK